MTFLAIIILIRKRLGYKKTRGYKELRAIKQSKTFLKFVIFCHKCNISAVAKIQHFYIFIRGLFNCLLDLGV